MEALDFFPLRASRSADPHAKDTKTLDGLASNCNGKLVFRQDAKRAAIVSMRQKSGKTWVQSLHGNF